MSKPVFRISNGVTLNAQVSGKLLNGWLAGTLVNIVNGYDNKYITIDVATVKKDVQGVFGFTLNGSLNLRNEFDYKFPNNNERGKFWTSDESMYLSKFEENKVLNFDKKDHQLTEMGNGIVTINYDGGCFKIYTYEKYDETYLSSNGQSGKEIDWESHIGESLGCSSRSLFTTLDNNVLKTPLCYRLGGIFSDENGEKYILIIKN